MSWSFVVGCCSDDASAGRVGCLLLGRRLGSGGSAAGAPIGKVGLMLGGSRLSSGEINVGAHVAGLKMLSAANRRSVDDWCMLTTIVECAMSCLLQKTVLGR